MEVVEISTTVLFEEMMKRLGLPSPTYTACVSGEARHVSSVKFYPATHCLRFAYGAISLASDPMENLEAANNDAAKRAIKYMERTEQKVLKDYNYDQLKKQKLIEDDHIHQAIKANRENAELIKEKDQKIKKIIKRWDNFIENVSTANNKIYLIAEDGYTIGDSDIERDINSTLWEVQKGTEHVKQLTFESTELLQEMCTYPSDTGSDPGESAQLSDCFLSPLHSPGDYIRSCLDDEYMYDSDGLCSMEDLHL